MVARKYPVLLSMLLANFFYLAKAQDTPTEAVESLLENILPAQYEEDVEVEQLYENLIQFYQEPLNLNAASAEELRQFFFLTDRQINNIIRYRNYYGLFLTKYELAHVPAMDRESINKLLLFVEIRALESRNLALIQRLNKASNRYLILRQSRILEQQKGFLLRDTLTDRQGYNYYPGSADQLYVRMRISQPGSISVGFTMEKDAGESLDWHPEQRKYGADFFSAHAQLENVGPFDQLIIGDFNLQAGQQLVFGSGLGLGKGAMTVRSVGRSQQGVRPYTSATESGFFRGLAASWKLPLKNQPLKLTVFYSSAARHARLRYDSASGQTYFRTFDLTGLHRSPSEMQLRRQLREDVIGGNLHYSGSLQNLQAGINFMNSSLSVPRLPAGALYRVTEFRGDHHQMGSSYFSYQLGHWNTFAELAYAGGQEWGMLAGVNGVLNSYLESVWLYRKYSAGFHNPYGNAFGESSLNRNEEGFYWGLQLEPLARLKVGAYYDMFRFGWLRFRVDAPSQGYEYLVRAHYQINRQTELTAQYRREQKGINVSADTLAFRVVRAGDRQNLMFNLDHRPNEALRLRTRIQSSDFLISDSLSRGWVVAQDVSYTLGRWKADARMALINTDDFLNRQYIYENDLLYTFSVPAYSGKGIRYYFMLRYKVNRHLSAWLRWGQTMYDDRDTVGSGLDEINGNSRTQVRTQLIFKL